jgi:thiamine pyrophosphokinase
MPAEERVQDEVVIVVSGGGSSRADVPHPLPDAPAIAADGGVDRALALGLRVELVIGDFDSAGRESLAAAAAAGARLERHPAEKDATDLELALDAALDRGARRVVVVGDGGGRLDHLVAGLLLLGSERYAEVTVDAYLGDSRVHVCRDDARAFEGTPGELVTLLALHGRAHGVRTEGLRYPLRGEDLVPGSSRGVSNELVAQRGTVAVERGTVLVVVPGVTEVA